MNKRLMIQLASGTHHLLVVYIFHSTDLENFLNSVDPSPILPLRNGRLGVNGTGRVWAANGRFLDPDTTSRQFLTHAHGIVHFLFVFEKIVLDRVRLNQSTQVNYCPV